MILLGGILLLAGLLTFPLPVPIGLPLLLFGLALLMRHSSKGKKQKKTWVREEWHLLKLLRVTIFQDFLSGDLSRLHQ